MTHRDWRRLKSAVRIGGPPAARQTKRESCPLFRPLVRTRLSLALKTYGQLAAFGAFAWQRSAPRPPAR